MTKVGGNVEVKDVRKYYSRDEKTIDEIAVLNNFFSDKNPDLQELFKSIHVENSTREPIF